MAFACGQGGIISGQILAGCGGGSLTGTTLRITGPDGYSFTPTIGGSTFSFSLGGLPAGDYTVKVDNPAGTYGAGTTVSPVSRTYTIPNGNQSGFDFAINYPPRPDFTLNGIAPSGITQLYKCAGTTSVPIGNTSTFQGLISQYRVTVFNSTAAGVIGTQFFISNWQPSCPNELLTMLPTAATGQYFVVLLEIQNSCGVINKSRQAHIRWNSGGVATVSSFKLNDWNLGCTTQLANCPGRSLAPISGGLCAVVGAGNNISQYRVRCFESTCTGSQTGVGVVLDETKPAPGGAIPQFISFSQLQGGSSWFFTNYNIAVGKQFRMEITVFNDCGWSSPAYSYFKIQPNCNFCLVSNNDEQEAVDNATIAYRNAQPATLDFSTMEVLPNPVTDIVNFKINAVSDSPVTLHLMDAQGRLVHQITNQLMEESENPTWSIDMRQLPVGFYFYRCLVGNQVWSGKILKQ